MSPSHGVPPRTGASPVPSHATDGAIADQLRSVVRFLARLTSGASGGEARHLATALAAGDAAAESILTETASDLAFGLSHAVHLFHPAAIVLGGGLALVGEPLRIAVERELSAFVMKAFAPGPRVCLATLAEDAVPVGALLLARLPVSHRG